MENRGKRSHRWLFRFGGIDNKQGFELVVFKTEVYFYTFKIDSKDRRSDIRKYKMPKQGVKAMFRKISNAKR